MYEFKTQDAYDFARHVNAQVREHNGELFFQLCPYCRPRPTRDNVRTFSISLDTGQFKCLRASCGVQGNMLTLSRDFDFSLGNEADEYYKPQRQFRKMKTPKEVIKPKAEALEYLAGRGISREVAEKYQITVQTKNPSILVFPFFDEKGQMQFVKYRKTDYDSTKDANKEWCEAKTKPILFGMKQCSGKFDRLIITEGQIDSLSVAQAGYENAVSVPTGAKGFTWVPYCWDWINKFQEVVVFGDYEKGSISLLDDLKKRLKSKVKHVRTEDYLDCKDANDILRRYGRNQIIKCIENAVPVPISRVIDLADVEDVDIFSLEKLGTGIYELDRLLYGGLPFGGVVLVTGKPGEGKSTLAGQIMVNAVEQGYKCFAYSGELPNYLFRAWTDFQAAGPHHITECQNEYGDRKFSISDTNKKLISSWYREKFYLYDSTAVDGDEHESLCAIVESVVMQYGVRVVLLDNLMTAVDLESGKSFDKYDRQSMFVKKLARTALKYAVLILLVAHKRKNNFSTNENDEVSGSGDISGLASITITYGRDSGLPDSRRLCKVSKNRLFGRVDRKGFELEFDEKSKRIYGRGDDVFREFGWSGSDGFYSADQEEIPFD